MFRHDVEHRVVAGVWIRLPWVVDDKVGGPDSCVRGYYFSKLADRSHSGVQAGSRQHQPVDLGGVPIDVGTDLFEASELSGHHGGALVRPEWRTAMAAVAVGDPDRCIPSGDLHRTSPSRGDGEGNTWRLYASWVHAGFDRLPELALRGGLGVPEQVVEQPNELGEPGHSFVRTPRRLTEHRRVPSDAPRAEPDRETTA